MDSAEQMENADADWEVILTSELEEQATDAESGGPGARSTSREEGSGGEATTPFDVPAFGNSLTLEARSGATRTGRARRHKEKWCCDQQGLECHVM